MRKLFRKLWRFVSSMKCGILLMVLLALACVTGSLVEQGHTLDWYLARYSERGAALIYGLSLDDVFHSGWFLTLALLLCGNLSLCTLLALPSRYQRWKDAANPETIPQNPDVSVKDVADPQAVFTRLRMPRPTERTKDGQKTLYSVKHRAGLWGAWICHLGVILLIIGFTFSQVKTMQYTIYGVPGQSGAVEDTRYQFTIDDFNVETNANGSVEQYSTRLTLRDTVTGETQSGSVGVNSPGSIFGFRVYQNSTGDAAKLTVTMDGEVRQEQAVCVGDGVAILNTPLILYLEAVEPEYFENGSDAKLPGYVYSTYYMGQADQSGVQVDGDVALTYGSVEISFSEPQSYTLLQLKQDNYAWIALVGGVVTLLGMLMAFYLQPKQVWAVEEDGGWTVYGAARKGKLLFAEQLREAAGLLDAPADETKGG